MVPFGPNVAVVPDAGPKAVPPAAAGVPVAPPPGVADRSIGTDSPDPVAGVRTAPEVATVEPHAVEVRASAAAMAAARGRFTVASGAAWGLLRRRAGAARQP